MPSRHLPLSSTRSIHQPDPSTTTALTLRHH
jgi:hypothetical protein